jgi:RNA polymerase sigma factor (sigma-70 family)
MKNPRFNHSDTKQSDNNFGLTKNRFEQLLSNLKSGDDRLYQEIFLSHFGDCIQYLKRSCRATQEDAYDASMDALLIFCDRLKKGQIKYGNLRFLFTQMAKQEYFRNQKKENKTSAIPEGFNIAEDQEEKISEEAQFAFDKAWDKIGEECKKLLQAFYYNRVKLKELAFEASITESTMRKQKQRCMTKLQAIFHRYYQV